MPNGEACPKEPSIVRCWEEKCRGCKRHKKSLLGSSKFVPKQADFQMKIREVVFVPPHEEVQATVTEKAFAVPTQSSEEEILS